MNNNNTFAISLKSILDHKKISQRTLAENINVKPATISRYINGTNEPKYEILVNIANFLDVTLDELLGRKMLKTNLTSDEQKVLNSYRSLSDTGKIIAKKQIEILKKNL